MTYNTIPEKYNRSNLITWDGIPLQRVARLATSIQFESKRIPNDSFGDCLDILRQFTRDASYWYPKLFTWKPSETEYVFVREFSAVFRGIYTLNRKWSKQALDLLLEFLRCTSESQFSLGYEESQKTRQEKVDPFLLFTALDYELCFSTIASIIKNVPGSVRGRHPESKCSPLSLACSTKTGDSAYVFDDDIVTMIEIDPSALRTLDRRERLPLHFAVEGDRKLDLIEKIIEAEPRALKTHDGLTKLYPFQLAAVGVKSGHPTNKGE